MPKFVAPVNGGAKGQGRQAQKPERRGRRQGEYITDLDLEWYLNYVVTTTPLKTPPSFDSKGVAGSCFEV